MATPATNGVVAAATAESAAAVVPAPAAPPVIKSPDAAASVAVKDGRDPDFATPSPFHPPTHPPAPLIEVRFQDVSQVVLMPQKEARKDIPTVASTIAATATFPFRALYSLATRGRLRPPPVPFTVLDNVSGVIKPGTLTL